MHQRDAFGLKRCQAAKLWRRVGRETERARAGLALDRLAEDVVLGDRRPVAAVPQDIAAEQRAGRLLEQKLSVPAMRQMRRRQKAHLLAAEINHLIIRDLAR